MSKPCNPTSAKAKQLDTYICNPKTGFWVLKSGATGKKILAELASQSKSTVPKKTKVHAVELSQTKSESSETLQQACLGKSKSQGGMNVVDMLTLAKTRGYTGRVNRAELTEFLCSEPPPSKLVKPVKPGKAKPVKPGKAKPAKTEKVESDKAANQVKPGKVKPAQPEPKAKCPSGNDGKIVFKGDVLLAKEYIDNKTKKPSINPVGWWMSEKYDGYRSIWNGKSFVSRSGKPFAVPDWFSALMPPGTALDGEFWIGRECFEQCGIFRKKKPDTQEWIKNNVVYKVFDLPASSEPFEARMEELKKIVEERCKCKIRLKLPKAIVTVRCPLQFTEHVKVKSTKQVETLLKEVIDEGGEGLMLRQPGSYYEQKRSNTLRKVKATFDTECKIIGYKPGTGKYKDKLGSFKCELLNKKGKPFFVSGMTDEIRDNYRKTHKKGTIITVTYNGLSQNGTPRHPRYLRKRADAGL